MIYRPGVYNLQNKKAKKAKKEKQLKKSLRNETDHS